eukprot:TRINITY_DN816_c0_g1_i2.p1 TRINITY_DN816_c0_g1~~TRINITY_DN816_c0_g1_i2.p1  ORF type:complete len:1801 (+),score=491.56 TRINITY_DN816_c0_g1_i2:1017-6419(+)
MKRRPSMVPAESHRPYSWWWDSHRPKNSKWIQENLSDMDLKIKAMLKLIEQDADSFAQRAEMYYKKRPEVVQLVEEFYRAYRALAERCDHITIELRQIHHSIAEAFPNQIQQLFHGDSPGALDGPMHPKDASSLDETDDAREASRLQGLKHLSEIFAEYGTTDKRVSQLREELKRVQEENQKMKEEWSSQLDEINILKEQIVFLKNQNGELEREGESLTQRLQNEIEEKENLRSNVAKVQDLQIEITHKEEENKKLQNELLSRDMKMREIEQKVNTAERERDSLQKEMEQIIYKMNSLVEELTASRSEEERLRKRLQEETNQSKNLETVLTSYHESLNDSQEQQRMLSEEIKAGTERLKEADRKVKILEEEIVQLQTENDKLMGQISSASVSIRNLEDEVLKLKQDKNNLLTEVALRVDQRNDLQKQLYSLQEERNGIDHQYQMLIKQLDSLGLDTKSFQPFFINLQDDNRRLRELNKKHQDESVEMAKNAESLERKLQERTRELEEVVSLHTEEVNRLKDELEKQHVFSEDLQKQNHSILSENEKKANTIGFLEKELHSSKDMICVLESKNSKLTTDLANSLDHAKKLENELHTLQLKKEKCEREIMAYSTEVNNLEAELCILQAERSEINDKLQEESDKLKSCQVEEGRFRDIIREMESNSMKLTNECQMLREENMDIKNRLKVLEREIRIKEEEGATLMNDLSSALKASTEQKEHLMKIQNFLSLPDAELEDGHTDVLHTLNAIFERIKCLQMDCLQKEKENGRLSVTIMSLSTTMNKLETQTADLQNERESLNKEVESLSGLLEEAQKEIRFLQDSAHDLRIEMQYSLEREACLEKEVNDLKHSLVSSQDEQLMLHAQHQEILEEYYALKRRIGCLEFKLGLSEEESCRHLSEALEKSFLVTMLEDGIAIRNTYMEKMIAQRDNLLDEKRESENKLKEADEKLQITESEVLHLKELILSFQEDKKLKDTLQEEFDALQLQNEEICTKIRDINELIKQKDSVITELKKEMQITQEENSLLVRNLQQLEQEYSIVQLSRGELQLQLASLEDEVTNLKGQLSVATNDRVMLEEKLQVLVKEKETTEEELSNSIGREGKLASDLKQLHEKEETARAEMRSLIEQNKMLESEIEKLYGSLQLRQMENTLLKDGNEKIYDLCRLLALKSTDVQEGNYSMQTGIFRQRIDVDDRLVRTRELARIIVDMQAVNNGTEDRLGKILGLLIPMKEDICCLKAEVKRQVEALRNDAQAIQDAFEKMQERSGSLPLEEDGHTPEVLRLQAQFDAIQHILIDMRRKNQTLQDESQKSIKELWNVKARLQSVLNKNAHLESQNRSLKAELHQQTQKAFQMQEERNVAQTELHLQLAEVETLKSELKVAKDLETCVLRLVEMLLGESTEGAYLNMESFLFAEEKLRKLYDELLHLKNENENLRNDLAHNSFKINGSEDLSSSKEWNLNVKSLGCGREMHQEINRSESGNSSVDLLKEKCTRLEIQVEKLTEKAEMFETKSREAQVLALKLEEMQQTLSNMQQLQMQVQGLQSRVKSLRKENVRLKSELKGELTPSRPFKSREGSHVKEADIADHEPPLLQEEKQVVVDESKKFTSSDNASQELDTLLDENKKYWNRVGFTTKQIQNLQNAVQELQLRLKNLKSSKKLKVDKWGGLDLNLVEKQLKELQVNVMQLGEHNNKLKKDVRFGFAWANSMEDMDEQDQKLKVDEEVPILCRQNSKIAEKLDNSTDKARSLEMEVQRIRLLLSRFQVKPVDDGPKMRVPLRAFLGGSSKEQQGKKQGCCACVRPATKD